MLNFTWDVFSKSGNVETYLLFKELEQDIADLKSYIEEEIADIDSPQT
ncbi:YqzL family protein [Bacillus sp. RG28]|uniref:YqzL family protein n=1 Tax=Gottfriedia endophytica TaxID=2820819 RepID=A0A940NMT7_9BACI|nr:YqzL family protein [Gottfriedia endophytica]MBP0723581.1 YqzL family protein [Gottfriedia endophytica]